MKEYMCLKHVNVMLKVLLLFLLSVYMVKSEKIGDHKQASNVSTTIGQDAGGELFHMVSDRTLLLSYFFFMNDDD